MRGQKLGVLVRGITANVNFFISSKVEKHGIKQGQYEYFLQIFSSPGINQLELGRLQNVGKASVTKALKILEDDGFVRRETDENDRRNTLCYITDKGEIIVDDLMDVKIKAEEVLFKGFKNEDVEIFYKYLMLLNQNSKALVVGIDSMIEKS